MIFSDFFGFSLMGNVYSLIYFVFLNEFEVHFKFLVVKFFWVILFLFLLKLATASGFPFGHFFGDSKRPLIKYLELR